MVLGVVDSTIRDSDSSVYMIDILTDAELIRSVERLKKQVRILTLENEVLEKSIMRLQPSLMTGAYSALDFALKWTHSQQQQGSGTTIISSNRSQSSRIGLHDTAQSYATMKSQSRMFHRKKESSIRGGPSSIKLSRSIIGGAGPKVNVEERLELVYALMEKEGKDLMKYEQLAKKQHDYLKAQLEEIAIRTDNFEKWTLNFNKEVIIDGVDPIAKRIPAEIWIRFLSEHGKKLDRQLDKMRIRMSSENIRHRKLREDYKRKKEWAERLVPVDFEVKTIEIKLALEKIDCKHTQLAELKALTGDANLNLTRYKNKMFAIQSYLKKVRDLTSLRERQTVKLHAERDLLASQVYLLEPRIDKLRELRQTFVVPNVLDYVSIQYRMSEMCNSIKRLETSLRIKQFALGSFRRESRRSEELMKNKLFKRVKSLKSSDREKPIDDLSTLELCKQCGFFNRNVIEC